MSGRRSEALGRWIAARPRVVLAAALLVTAVSLVPASRFRLDTDLSALFPAGSPAAAEYRQFLDAFGGFEKVFVVVRAGEGAPADAGTLADSLADAAGLLAERLAASPEVAGARAGLTPEDEEFFLRWVAPRAALLLPAGRRGEIALRLDPGEIHRRVAALRQTLRSPAGSFAAPLLAADPLGIAEPLLAAASALPVDPATGAFLSSDGDAALVVVTPARPEIDPEGGRRLVAALERAYSEVGRELGGPQAAAPLRFAALGGPIYAAHDEAAVRADLTRITLTSMAAVGLVLLVGFEGPLIPFALAASVVAGVAWTAGLVQLALGGLTVAGVGFIAVLFGMGVEYGIHGGSRFRLLRLRGERPREALAGACRDTGPGVVSTALTTAVALAALALAHFRPLREMGQVLAAGVLVLLVSTILVGGPMLVLFRERRARGMLYRRFWAPLFEALVGFAARRPLPVLAMALLLSAAAAWGLRDLRLDPGLSALRPADHPLAAVERLVVEEFGLGLDTSTAVVRGRDLDEALDRAARVAAALGRALGPGAEVTSPSDWVISGERLRSRLRDLSGLPLGAAADALERELAAAGFRREPFAPAIEALRRLDRGEDPGAPPPGEWPSWMSELVRLDPQRAQAPGPREPREPRKPGGVIVAVHARAPIGRWPEGPPPGVMRELRAAAPGVAVASAPRVGAELRDIALSDLARSSGVAALLVALVVLVSLGGRIGESLLASLPLALGCLWTFGLWGAAGRSLDLLSIATLPVLLGTGIDLGVHAVHGARAHPRGLRGAVAESGLAMTLVVLTTGAGFGSLGTSRVPGLESAGWLVAAGVTACLLATLLVLPALEGLRRARGRRDEGPLDRPAQRLDRLGPFGDIE